MTFPPSSLPPPKTDGDPDDDAALSTLPLAAVTLPLLMITLPFSMPTAAEATSNTTLFSLPSKATLTN